MKPFRREQRESRPGGTQPKGGLRAEDRSCSRACAVRSWLTFLEYEPEQIVVLSHAKILSGRAISRSRILLYHARNLRGGGEPLRERAAAPCIFCEIRA